MLTEIQQAGWTIRVETELPLNPTELSRLIEAFRRMCGTVTITRFRWTRQADPTKYLYRFDTADGRVWRQTLTFESPTDANPTMTFDAPEPGWSLAEFEPHRPWRSLVIELRNRARCSSIRVDAS